MRHDDELYLATVVFQLTGADPDALDRRALDVRDMLLGHENVVSVRPDGGVTTWLYRMDVWGPDRGQAAAQAGIPARRLAAELGAQATMHSISLMSEAEGRAFNRQFTSRADRSR